MVIKAVVGQWYPAQTMPQLQILTVILQMYLILLKVFMFSVGKSVALVLTAVMKYLSQFQKQLKMLVLRVLWILDFALKLQQLF